MRNYGRSTTAALLITSAASISAQTIEPCDSRAFGIVRFTCESCGLLSTGRRVLLTFDTEPLVRETRAETSLRGGDVIVAINGTPITTREGAALFSEPAVGNYRLTVRRGGVEQPIPVAVSTAGCSPIGFQAVRATRMSTDSLPDGRRVAMTDATVTFSVPETRRDSVTELLKDVQRTLANISEAASIQRAGIAAIRQGQQGQQGQGQGQQGQGQGQQVQQGQGQGQQGQQGQRSQGQVQQGQGQQSQGQIRSAGSPVSAAITDIGAQNGYIVGASDRLKSRIDQYLAQAAPPPDRSRFGFAIACLPCNQMVQVGGNDVVWVRAPSVSSVRDGSPAAVAGLRVGDVIVSVDGLSSTSEAGAAAFAKASSPGTESLRVRITRAGTSIELTLFAKK